MPDNPERVRQIRLNGIIRLHAESFAVISGVYSRFPDQVIITEDFYV